MNIVNVQFKNRFSPFIRSVQRDEFGGPVYAYIADVPVAVGDVVTVPTAYGDREAKVCRVDIPTEELPRTLSVERLKHITEPAIPGDAFAGFFE